MSSHPAPRVSLNSALSVDAAWAEVIKPWFERTTRRVQAGQKSCVVVSPTRGIATSFKNRALEEGMSLLGVRFWSPGELREELMKVCGVNEASAPRDVMGLIAASIAEEAELAATNDGAKQMAGAVARAPEAFLRAYDQVNQAGWDPIQHLPGALREIARAFGERLARAGFRHLAQIDRELKIAMKSESAAFSQLLLVGFDGAHWPLFPLLSASACAAEETAVVFTEPRDEARAVDSLWMGTWEQEFATISPMAGEERERPMAEVLSLPESKTDIERRTNQPAQCIDFLVAETAGDLSTVISNRVLETLAVSESPRIAVVFRQASALSRLVSKRLAELQVPHNDALGHPLADAVDDPAWKAWLQVQEDRRAGPFLRLIQECPKLPQFSAVDAKAVQDSLWKELAELLIDDLTVLAESLGSRELQPNAQSIAAGIRELVWLPERAEIAEMYAQTLRAFTQMGWKARVIDFRRKVAGWIGLVRGTISRRFWLNWLEETLAFTERQRERAGRHPYARVHLISFADAASLEWSHVVLAGLNENDWPLVSEEEGWLSEGEIAALNNRARRLNSELIEQGRHGEGHEALSPGHTWCLTSGDARGILQRQFLNLMENASEGVAVTATLRLADQPERLSPPAEFFGRLYFCARGRAVSPAILEELRAETSRWMKAGAKISHPAVNLDEVKETRKAWDIRRKDGKAFGEYEFALKKAPTEPISLTATKWERALRTPALVFLEQFLGVSEPAEADPDFTKRAIGSWAHRWLAKIISGDGFNALPPSAERGKNVRKAAKADRHRVETLLSSCGRMLPDWWIAIWEEALSMALGFVDKLPTDAAWSHGATEFRMKAIAVPIGQGSELRLSGRMDLVLAQSSPNGSRIPAGLVWIVDYKTGDAKELKTNKFADGDGLQLGLYGLAARLAGATTVHMSRLGPSLSLEKAQITCADLNGLDSLWEGLVQIQETGRFGLLGEIRSEFGTSSTYPLATLAIDQGVLDSKWALTHPKFNGTEETNE